LQSFSSSAVRRYLWSWWVDGYVGMLIDMCMHHSIVNAPRQVHEQVEIRDTRQQGSWAGVEPAGRGVDQGWGGRDDVRGIDAFAVLLLGGVGGVGPKKSFPEGLFVVVLCETITQADRQLVCLYTSAHLVIRNGRAPPLEHPRDSPTPSRRADGNREGQEGRVHLPSHVARNEDIAVCVSIVDSRRQCIG
jgi:hypothetical protein